MSGHSELLKIEPSVLISVLAEKRTDFLVMVLKRAEFLEFGPFGTQSCTPLVIP